MKLLLAGGGTAGHINPALAIAGYVCQREPATQILYVGAKGGMERLVPQAGYDFEKIEISGFQESCPESLKKCPYRKAGVLIQQRGKKNYQPVSAGSLHRHRRLRQRSGDPAGAEDGNSHFDSRAKRFSGRDQ
ncbi:MAG: glycosyltransferase [[Clostridium] leptum]